MGKTAQSSLVKTAVVSVLVMTPALSSLAHHSFVSHYDPNRTMEITGTVVQFDMRSPHSFVIIDSTGEDGSPKRWEVETDSVPGLRRKGIDKETFKPGDTITVTVWPNRKPDHPLVFGRQFTNAAGQIYGSSNRPDETEIEVADVAGTARLNGRWMTPPPRRTEDVLLPLNDKGKHYWETFDPQISSANACVPATIPSIYYAPYLVDVRIDEDTVIVQHEVFSVTRTVRLEAAPARAEDSGWFGLVTARLDGSELVVESTRFPPSGWGLAIAAGQNGGGRDIPSSPEKKTVERFSVSEDGRTLRVDYTLEDPEYLTEPYSSYVELRRVAEDTPIYPFDCTVGSAARFSAPS